MAKINVLQKRVGLPNPVTGVVAPQSQLPAAIGQFAQAAAGVAGKFAQQYEQAKYTSGKTDTETAIKREANLYFESLKETPVVQKEGEDFVRAQERSWNDFSEKIQNDIIGKIDNKQLQEDMSSWWQGASEDQRSSVVNRAIDEDIVVMGNNMVDSIEFMTQQGNFATAKGYIEEGQVTGLFDRSKVDALTGYVDQQKALAEAQSLPFEESIQFTREQGNLTTEQRNENIRVLEANREAAILKEAETVKARDENLVKAAGNQIFTGQYNTIEELNQQLVSGQLSVLSGDDQEDLRRDWYFYDGKRKQGLNDDRPDKSDTSAQLDIENLSVTGTATEFSNALRKYRDEDKLSFNDYTKYSALLFEKRKAGTTVFNPVVQGVIERINDLDPKIYTDADKLALEQNFVQYAESDALGAIRPDNQNLQDTDALNKWLDNQITEKGNIKFDESIRQIYGSQAKYFKDVRSISGYEELAIEAEAGRLIGIVQPEKLNTYFSDPTPSTAADLQESLSRNAYGRSYEKLNSAQQSNIDRNLDVVAFTESGKQLAVKELGMNAANMRIVMHRDGYPMYQNENNELFSLRMESADKKILGWYKYFGTRNGEDVFHLYQAVEEPEKGPGILDKVIDFLTPEAKTGGSPIPDFANAPALIPINVNRLPRSGTN